MKRTCLCSCSACGPADKPATYPTEADNIGSEHNNNHSQLMEPVWRSCLYALWNSGYELPAPCLVMLSSDDRICGALIRRVNRSRSNSAAPNASGVGDFFSKSGNGWVPKIGGKRLSHPKCCGRKDVGFPCPMFSLLCTNLPLYYYFSFRVNFEGIPL